ncbi:MAG TPA: lasso peptide biosynthesis B2 protein [Polyangiaceae bacterium]|jgi:transglutaminase superfamily protein|nr:lasso peptide biosynthesis B2 protein [Polyangiaceae bacterium]
MSTAKLLRAYRRLRASRPREIAFAARAWVLAVPVEASLAAFGLARTLRWIREIPAGPRRRGAVSVDEGQLLVARAYQLHLLRGQCLPRSLVQYLLHRREGVAARFVVGVRRADGLDAHAWVEAEGSTNADGRYAPLLVTEL